MPYKFTNAVSSWGASMGRGENITEKEISVKFHLERVNLNQGYDKGGAYWGNGQPLYVAYGDGKNEVQELFTRANNREDAKKYVRELFPNCKFFR